MRHAFRLLFLVLLVAGFLAPFGSGSDAGAGPASKPCPTQKSWKMCAVGDLPGAMPRLASQLDLPCPGAAIEAAAIDFAVPDANGSVTFHAPSSRWTEWTADAIDPPPKPRPS